MNEYHSELSRRGFISGAASTAAFSVVASQSVRGAEANSKIRVGVIGCGGRGNLISGLMAKHGGYEVVAVADYFQDRADNVGKKLGVPEAQRFTSLSGYRRLLDLDLDAVAVMSPPYFHPEQATAAVDSGRHVYVAKPIAVDVPGCRSIAASGKKASKSGLCFLVDFQTRANDFYIEAVKRVHDGALGEIAFGEAAYHANRLKAKTPDGPGEARLRNWVFDKALSGDIITEQNIHAIDVMGWIMNADPLHAVGSGGRKVRVDVGDCWDHFALLYQYPDGVGVTFSSRQFNGHGSAGGIINRVFGSKGVLETKYGGEVLIRGGKESFYRGGATNNIYKGGAGRNVATFHDNIVAGRSDNSTVEPSAHSNQLTIMGRTAAYEGRLVTWDETVNSNAVVDGRLKGLKA